MVRHLRLAVGFVILVVLKPHRYDDAWIYRLQVVMVEASTIPARLQGTMARDGNGDLFTKDNVSVCERVLLDV